MFKEYAWYLRTDSCYYIAWRIFKIRDYSERMYVTFNLEIKSEYFGNGKSLSIEGHNLDVVDGFLNIIYIFIPISLMIANRMILL